MFRREKMTLAGVEVGVVIISEVFMEQSLNGILDFKCKNEHE